MEKVVIGEFNRCVNKGDVCTIPENEELKTIHEKGQILAQCSHLLSEAKLILVDIQGS